MTTEKVDDIRSHIIEINDLFEQLKFFKNKNDELKKSVSDLEDKLKSSLTLSCNSNQIESNTESLLIAKKDSEEKIAELKKNFQNEKALLTKTYQDLLIKNQELQFNLDFANSNTVKHTEDNNDNKLVIEKLLNEKKNLQERLKTKDIEQFELDSFWKEKFEEFKKNSQLEEKKKSESQTQLEKNLNEYMEENSLLTDQIRLLESNCENLKTQLRVSHENNIIAPIMLNVSLNNQMSPVTELPECNLADFINPIQSPLPEIKSDKSTVSPCRSPTPKLQETNSIVSSIESKYDINNVKNRARIKRRRIINQQNRTSLQFNKRKVIRMIRGANRLKIFLRPADKDVLFVDCNKRHRNYYEFRNVTEQFKMFQNWRQQCSSSSNMFTPMPMINPYNFIGMGSQFVPFTQTVPPQFMPSFINTANNMTQYPMMFQSQPDCNENRHNTHKSKKSNKRSRSPKNIDDNNKDENHGNSKLTEDMSLLKNSNQSLSEDIIEPVTDVQCKLNNVINISDNKTILNNEMPKIITKDIESVPEKSNNKKIIKVSKLNRIRNKLIKLSLNHKIPQEVQLQGNKVKKSQEPKCQSSQPPQQQKQEQEINQIEIEPISVNKIQPLILKPISKTQTRTEGFKKTTMKRSCNFTSNETIEKRRRSDSSINYQDENNIQEIEQENHDITADSNNSDKIVPISIDKPLVDKEINEVNITIKSPIKTNKNLDNSSIRNLLSNFINNISNGVSDSIDDIIETLSNVNMLMLRNSIMNMLEKNVSDELDKTYTPPAPALSVLQQKLILLVSKLETRAGLKDLFDECLKFIENRIRRKTSLDYLLSLSRFFIAVCKLKNNIYRLRSYCISVMYYLNVMSIPVWFLVLTQWSEVLPKADCAKHTPLIWVVIHFIKNIKILNPKYQLNALQKLILNYYEYNEQRYNVDDLLKQLLDFYEHNNSSCCEFSFALLFTIENKTWAKNQIIKKIMPLAEKTSDNCFKNLVYYLTVQLGDYDLFLKINN